MPTIVKKTKDGETKTIAKTEKKEDKNEMKKDTKNGENTNLVDFIPDDNSKFWVDYNPEAPKDKKILKYNKPIPELEYSVTPELIKRAETGEYIIENFNSKYHIYKIYRVYDSKDDKKEFIMYSKNCIEAIIVNDLVSYNKKESKTGRLGILSNGVNVRYKLLGCYKTEKDNELRKELSGIKKTLENTALKHKPIVEKEKSVNSTKKKEKTTSSQHKSNGKNVQTFETSVDKYKKFMDKNEDKTYPKSKFIISKIMNPNNDKEVFIHGSYDSLKRKDVDKIVEKYCIQFTSPNAKLKIEVVNEVMVRSYFEGLVYVDDEIKKNNTIDNGLNRFYNIIDEDVDDDRLFLMYQQICLDRQNFVTVNKGYVAVMLFGEKKFVFCDYNRQIKDKLHEYYNMKRHCEYQFQKLIDQLKVTKLSDIKIIVLEHNIEQNNLCEHFYYYINRYDKEDLLNYNDEYFAKPDDLKKVTGLIYGTMYRKKKNIDNE